MLAGVGISGAAVELEKARRIRFVAVTGFHARATLVARGDSIHRTLVDAVLDDEIACGGRRRKHAAGTKDQGG
ncbi:MAG TPA: hypothetical protein VKA89_04165 [Solirubrobacterales bacterium]|nr:hypothetical protein [Solirubrobacterales bacterium]